MSSELEKRSDAIRNFRNMFNYAADHVEHIVTTYGNTEGFYPSFSIDAFYRCIIDCMVSDGIIEREYADEIIPYSYQPLCKYDSQLREKFNSGVPCTYCPIIFSKTEEVFMCASYISRIGKYIKSYGNETNAQSRKTHLIWLESLLRTIARLPQNKTV